MVRGPILASTALLVLGLVTASPAVQAQNILTSETRRGSEDRQVRPVTENPSVKASKDSDGDGLPDDIDLCPRFEEDIDTFQDDDGCPDVDNDRDGMVDVMDFCPLQAGPIENRYCPDTDRDGDSVADRIDNCPDRPGTAEYHGCTSKQWVYLTAKGLATYDEIHFESNRSRIRSHSRNILDNMVEVLEAHPEIILLRVEGHTDDLGSSDVNRRLSQRRAESVKRYLVRQGINRSRLIAVGFGEDKPLAEHETHDGRAKNRRVEFNISGTSWIDLRRYYTGQASVKSVP